MALAQLVPHIRGDEEAHAAQSPAGEQGVHHSQHYLATETIRAQNPVSGPCFGPAAGNIEEARRWCDSRDKQKKRRSHSKQWLDQRPHISKEESHSKQWVDQRPRISMLHFIVKYMSVREKETHSVSKIKTKLNQ